MEGLEVIETPKEVKEKKVKVQPTMYKVKHFTTKGEGGNTWKVPATSINPDQVYLIQDYEAIKASLFENEKIESEIVETF